MYLCMTLLADALCLQQRLILSVWVSNNTPHVLNLKKYIFVKFLVLWLYKFQQNDVRVRQIKIETENTLKQ